MSKFGKALAVLALVAAVSATSAQAQSRIIIGGGSTLGLSDLNDAGYSNGPHLIGGYEYVSKSGFGVRLDGMYHRIYGDDQPIPGNPAASNRIDVFNGTLNALYVFPTAGNLKPYLIAGIGYYNTKLAGEFGNAQNQDSESDFGFNAGAGFEGGKTLKYFAEARFHQIQSSDDAIPDSFNTRVAPISVGVKIPLGVK
jgi:opacity protein-like surface antigen